MVITCWYPLVKSQIPIPTTMITLEGKEIYNYTASTIEYVRLVLTSAAHILKIGMIQRRLAWALRKDDTQIREAFLIFQMYRTDF